MSFTKYLEIDSTYRDRTVWPLPGRFDMLIAQRTSFAPLSAVDPVSTSTPVAAWQSNRFLVNTPGSAVVTGLVNASDSVRVNFAGTNGQLQTEPNYYRNAFLTSSTGVSSRVMAYRYLGLNQADITIAPNMTLTPGSTVTITDPTNLALSRVFVPASPDDMANFYAGDILYDETTGTYAPIAYFDPMMGLVNTTQPIAGWSSTDSFSIRQTPPLLTGPVGATSTTTAVQISPTTVTGLPGSFIRILPTYPATQPGGETSQIVSFDPATNVATIYPPLSASPVGFEYEVLAFSYDNFNPFVYNATLQNEFITYSMRLLNLTIPNIVLSVGNGGRAQDYSYLYVKLTPKNTMNQNISSSNNPNSTYALFRATKRHNDDSTAVTRFVNFYGDDATQRVKFKLESDLDFEVTLPNGQTFATLQSDDFSPSAPNPLVQISALFEIIRY